MVTTYLKWWLNILLIRYLQIFACQVNIYRWLIADQLYFVADEGLVNLRSKLNGMNTKPYEVPHERFELILRGRWGKRYLLKQQKYQWQKISSHFIPEL